MYPSEMKFGDSPAPMSMMGELLIPDERIQLALKSSKLVENLHDFEINVLANLIAVHYFEVKEFTVDTDDELLSDALMILIEGKIEISALVDKEPVSLLLESPGDLARVMSFVTGNILGISAQIKIHKNSAVLLLKRQKLELLLYSHPAIVYSVMRNLVSHVHSQSRRKDAEKEQMSNYLYRTHGLY